jgi:hypothetical protein
MERKNKLQSMFNAIVTWRSAVRCSMLTPLQDRPIDCFAGRKTIVVPSGSTTRSRPLTNAFIDFVELRSKGSRDRLERPHLGEPRHYASRV